MFKILFCVFAFSLAAQAEPVASFTEVKQLQGRDDRGSYKIHYLALTEKVADPAVRAKVNAAMEAEAKVSTCVADHAQRRQMESVFFAKVSYSSPVALAVEAHTFLFCGTSADGGVTSYLYDLSTGETVDFESQMRDLEGFRSAVAEELLANLPREQKGCAEGYTRENFMEHTLNFTVAEGKIVVSPVYGPERRDCIFAAGVPFAKIAGFVQPGSTLDKIIAESKP